MEECKHLHDGHRQRLLESYRSAKLEGFSDIVVLEFLLTFAIPRKDTNAISHLLLKQFGSLAGVFDAPLEALLQIKGMTQRAAALINMQTRLWKRYDLSRQSNLLIFPTNNDCGNYLVPFFRGAREEQVWMMSLDAKCKLLDCRQISTGSVNSTSLPARKVVEAALAVNASSVVLAHNHTSGIALPSQEDIAATRILMTALDCVDVFLVDHIVIADEDYVSMRDSKLI